MNGFNIDEIEQAVATINSSQISPDLPGVIYSLGRDAANDEEYEYAFQLLVLLSAHHSAYIVSMVILGFSLLAVNHGCLDRTIVEPIIKRGWKRADGSDKARIQDAVDDINHLLKWNLRL